MRLPAVPPRPRRSSGWCSISPQYAPTVLGPTETFHNGNGSYSAAEQEQVFRRWRPFTRGFSSSIKFSIDPAEITQLRSMTHGAALGHRFDTCRRDDTCEPCEPTFTNYVYENGNGNYVTVYYNDTPIFNSQPSPGGFSNEVDFGNLNQKTTVQLDVNGFLGTGPGLVPDSTADSSTDCPIS